MNNERKGFVFYKSWWITIVNLPREVQMDAINAIMEYGFKGAESEQLKPIAKAILTMAKPQIDANYKRWQNGLKGGCPKGKVNNTNGRKGKENNREITKNKPTSNQKITENKPKVKVKDKDNINSFSNENESLNSSEFNAEMGTEINFEGLKDYFNKQVEEHGSVFPKITIVSEERRKLIRARIKQYGKEAFAKAIQNAVTSEFLNSRSGFGFDWIIRPRNFPKVLEGNYNNNVNGNQENHQQKPGGVHMGTAQTPGYGLIED